MKAVSLTTFVDFINKAGSPKMTVVRKWLDDDEYDPRKDYWKRLRDGIVNVHSRGQSLDSLDRIASQVPQEKQANYKVRADAYKRWANKKDLAWFNPPSGNWRRPGVVVSVNPELGLEIDGDRCIIKLYFKEDKLPANRAALILQMMCETFSRATSAGTQVCVLDVRKGKLHRTSRQRDDYTTQLIGEAAYWGAVVARLDRAA